MRKRILTLMLLIFAMTTSISAYNFMVDGLCYNKNSDGTSVYITYHHSSWSDGTIYYYGNTSLSGALNIPSTVTYNGVTYSVTSIGEYAFYDCTGLTSATIPNSVTSIGSYAFSYCSGLTSATIPNSVTSIGAAAFCGCSGLTSVTIPNSVTSIGEGAFSNCSSLTSVAIPNSVTSIGSYAFSYCSGLTSVTIPNSVTSIGGAAFCGCSGLTSLTIPNSVTSIGEYTFYDCTGLTSATIPNSVTSIGSYAFSGCRSLTSVTIPNSVTSIPNQCFYNCRSLTSVTIPNSVTSIGESAFSRCTGLISIFCQCITPPSVNSYSFSNVQTSSVDLYVPKGSLDLYNNHSVWKNFRLIGTGPGTEIPVFGDTEGTGGFSGSGSGTESDPYLIFNPIQLYDVRHYTGYNGVVFKLMADIDLTQFLADNNPTQGWEPIGSQDSPFKGVFLGEGHKITGLYINRPSIDFVGFFGAVDDAQITDFQIENAIFQGGDYTSSLIGCVKNADISDITVTATVNGQNLTGGLIGLSYLSDIDNCLYTGNVSGRESTGGFVGYMIDGSITQSNCSSNVDGSSYDYIGGFAGTLASATISLCKQDGDVNGANCVGGFAGHSANAEISNAESYGYVNASSTQAGGFAGYVYGLKANDCYSIGDVEGTQDYVGGFLGYNSGISTVTKCGAIGNVSGKKDSNGLSAVGGLVGYNTTNSTLTVNNSFAVGDITATGHSVGGVVGSANDAVTVQNTYFSGNVTGLEKLGGIVGYGNNCTLKYNYANGSVMGKSEVGGIAGCLEGTSDVSSCVATQDMINASDGMIGRIYGSAESTCTMGAQGTSNANRAMTTMKVISEGTQLSIEDSEQHGTSVGKSLLKYKSTYQGIGWDFTNDWTILETESYPYKPSQSAPPVIFSTAYSGGTSMNGKCVQGARVFLLIDGETYEAQVSGTTWTVTLPPMQAGVTIKVYAIADGLIQSYYVTTVVGYAGDGTEESPYLIYSAQDLANINSYSYYKVMNDIDLTEWINANGVSTGWYPIGLNGSTSLKQLDGNGHTITGLWIDSNNSYNGLFARLYNATIKNLTVIVSDGKTVKSTESYVGIIAGMASNTSLENVRVEGEVNGIAYVGGMVGSYGTGNSDAAISDCYADVVIRGNDYIGGIAGYAADDINKSYASGNILTNDTINCRAGGIVGYTIGDIANCYSTAYTRGGQYAGGITGYSFGAIDKCYSCGDIYANNFGGGIVGYLDGANASVNNCFAINNRIDVRDQHGVAMRVIGGIKNGAATPLANNYALKTMVVSVNDVTQTIYDDLLHGIGVTQNQLQSQATYAAQGWDFTDVWGIDEGSSYPYLLALVEPETPDFTPGDVNGDGTIDVADYVDVASYILEQDPQPFVFAAADLDEDNSIDVGDLVAVAYMALTFEGAPRMEADIALEAACIAMDAAVNGLNGNYEVTINLSNNIALSALQMDLNLPQGMTLVDATLSDRASISHQVTFNQLANGDYRLLASSSTCKSFNGNDGTVLMLSLAGEPSGNAIVRNIKLATPRATSYEVDDIELNFNPTGVDYVTTAARIYSEGGKIVIISPNDGIAQIVLPNGMNKTVKVAVGRNVFDSPAKGLVIVKMGNEVKKIRF